MFNNQYMINSLNREKQKIDEIIENYRNQEMPSNTILNLNRSQNVDMVSWRVLNENEEVDNLYVPNKTVFINDKLMVLKCVDGSMEKWEIKKIYPIDKKDEKINQLEEEIRKLKEMINNEPTKLDSTVREVEQPNSNVNVNAEPKSKTASKSISKQNN